LSNPFLSIGKESYHSILSSADVTDVDVVRLNVSVVHWFTSLEGNISKSLNSSVLAFIVNGISSDDETTLLSISTTSILSL